MGYSGEVTVPEPPLQKNVPLAPFTTFGIGGPADLLTRPKSADELAATVRWGRQEKIPWFVLGTGANILVGDKGFRGLVIKNEAAHFSFSGPLLTAESGVTIAKLIEVTTEKGLSGLEYYINIVSTLGGALWQNLHFLSYPHTHTEFIANTVRSATVLVGDTIKKVDREYFKFGYDTSILHERDDVVLDATLELVESTPAQMKEVQKHNAAWRRKMHPPNAERMSAGSIFQKIEGVGAGRLVDAAGLKGYRLGGAEVSERHANYILNVDHATAADVRALIAHIQKTVKAQSGYQLEPEISFVGEF